MKHLKSFGEPINEEIFGINKAIGKGIGTYREPVYVYIMQNPDQSLIQNDWIVASAVNRRLMEMMDDKFDIEEESNSWKIKNEDIDEIETFLKSLGLTSKKFKEGESNRIVYRGKLSLKDLKEYDSSLVR